MHKDHKALFRLSIKKAEENLHRIDSMRDDLRDMDRKLVLMENAISQSINDLRRLYTELNSKEEA